MNKGRLFVISGPSGAGKGTICDQLVKKNIAKLSVSMTTRAIRGAEIPGLSYYFVSDDEFDKTIEQNGFLEYAGIYGHRYGTPKAPVLKDMDEGNDVILEIEMQGAMQVKENYSDAILIFILPPSLEELLRRLKGRNSDSEDQIKDRSSQAISEIKKIVDYDYFIINDKLEDAVLVASNIIKAEHDDCLAKTLVSENRVDEIKIDNIIQKYEKEAN